MNQPLELIREQIKEAKPELDAYPPAGIDWYARCLRTADTVIPWLTRIAPGLCGFCEEVYNSPERVRELWLQLKTGHTFGKPGEQLDLQLAREKVLIKEIAGDVVSRIMTDYLMADSIGKALSANGHSDYPDLYLSTSDYSTLPQFDRKQKKYGAALKGKRRKPVRVPDGIEIKTCRNSFRVDCHYYHMGLHVALFYTERDGRAKMCDLLAAFLRESDYTKANRNTDATTAKASFGPRRFVSLMPGGCVPGAVKGLQERSSSKENF